MSASMYGSAAPSGLDAQTRAGSKGASACKPVKTSGSKATSGDLNMSLTPRGPREFASPRIGAQGKGFQPTSQQELLTSKVDELAACFGHAGSLAVEVMQLTTAYVPGAAPMAFVLGKSCEAVTAAGDAFLGLLAMLIATVPVPQEAQQAKKEAEKNVENDDDEEEDVINADDLPAVFVTVGGADAVNLMAIEWVCTDALDMSGPGPFLEMGPWDWSGWAPAYAAPAASDAVDLAAIEWVVEGPFDHSTSELVFLELAPHDWSGWSASRYTPPCPPMLEDSSSFEFKTCKSVDWSQKGLNLLKLAVIDWSAEGLAFYEVPPVGWNASGVPL